MRLVNELRNKDCDLNAMQKDLSTANKTLNRLENDLNNLSNDHNKNKDQTKCFNNNLIRETNIRNQVECDNQKNNVNINDRNQQISK